MRDKLISFLKHWSLLYHFIQVWYWRTRGFQEHILGTKVQERYWVKRHLHSGNHWNNTRHFSKKEEWITSYWSSRNCPHRRFLMEKIANFFPFSSILEIGCNCGPNLYLIAKKFPNIKIKGIDINPMAVQNGNKCFAEEGISNVKLLVGKADELGQFQDKSFDIVFTDAVLIYIGPDKIEKVVREMFRITRKALIFVEWHENSEDPKGLGIYHFGPWKRDYVNLLKQFVHGNQINTTKIPKELWPDKNWRDLGYIIEVIL